MPYRRRKLRRTIGKDARRMMRTEIDNLVAGTPQAINFIQCTIGASVSGTGDVYENADSETFCSPNELIKYINIMVEYAVNQDIVPANPGHVEYALVLFQEEDAAPPLDSGIQTNFGTQTIGETCVNLYRGKCIWNGAIPVSVDTPQVLNLKIKIPEKFAKMKRGQYWQWVQGFRSVNAAESTTTVRSVFQSQFKAYA